MASISEVEKELDPKRKPDESPERVKPNSKRLQRSPPDQQYATQPKRKLMTLTRQLQPSIKSAITSTIKKSMPAVISRAVDEALGKFKTEVMEPVMKLKDTEINMLKSEIRDRDQKFTTLEVKVAKLSKSMSDITDRSSEIEHSVPKAIYKGSNLDQTSSHAPPALSSSESSSLMALELGVSKTKAQSLIEKNPNTLGLDHGRNCNLTYTDESEIYTEGQSDTSIKYDSSCTDSPFDATEVVEVEQLTGEEIKEDTAYAPTVMNNSTPQATNLSSGGPVSITIIKHSEQTTVTGAAVRSIPEPNGNANSTDSMKDQTEKIVNWFKKKDHLYVETSAFKELKAVIDEMYWATLLGMPGDGKSAAAAHLMLQYRDQGYEPIFLSSAQDWKTMILSRYIHVRDIKQFVVIDDMFGTTCVDDRKVSEWISCLDNMEKIIKESKGNVLIVCTSRRYIFKDVESSIAKFTLFMKISIVDMTDKSYRLSDADKEQIFKTFAHEYGIEITESCWRIKFMDPPHGFPHCVALFCTNAYLRQNGLSFFRNPVKCVQKEITNFKDNDHVKFLVLLLVCFNNNHVDKCYFGSLMDTATVDEKKMFRAAGVLYDTAYPSILKALVALENTYLNHGPDGSYTFSHESLMENVAFVYCCINPTHALKVLQFQHILSFINSKDQHEESLGGNATPIHRLPIEQLAKRVTTEIAKGNVHAVCSCNAWCNETFVSTWIKDISSGLNGNLESILCSYDSKHGYSEYEQTLLGSLLHHDRKLAVIALLENKAVRDIMKHSSAWSKLLHRGLETVCSGTGKCDISIVKAFTSLHHEEKATIDGSESLIHALMKSDAECAKLLMQETKIRKWHNYALRYFLGITQSKLSCNDAKSIFIMLFNSGIDMTARDQFGRNMIHCLCEKLPDPEFTDMIYHFTTLIASELDLNIQDYFGRCIMHLLFQKVTDSRFTDLIYYLTERGVNYSLTDKTGKVPLMLALQNDPGIDCIQHVLEKSPRKHTDSDGRGYFHYLFTSKCPSDTLISYCNLLQKMGEDINAIDNSKRSPIFARLEDRNCSLKELEYFRSVGVDFHLSDSCGRNIMHYLFSKCPCPKLSEPCYENSNSVRAFVWEPPGTSSDNQLTDMYTFLTETAQVDPFHKDDKGVNPLMLAIQNCIEYSCVKDWVNQQIPSQKDINGESYFHFLARSHACDDTFEEIKSALLKKEMDLDQTALLNRRLPVEYMDDHDVLRTSISI